MLKQIFKIITLCVSLIVFDIQLKNPLCAASYETQIQAPALAEDKVYVMYVASCPMCEKALKYLSAKYQNNQHLSYIDLETPQGKEMLRLCRKKFGFKDVYIPLICAKDEYSMGWSNSVAKKTRNMLKKAR